MYIVSKFHDFYDSAMGLGIDKTVVYNRNLKELPLPNKVTQRPLYDLIEKLPAHRDGSTWSIRGYCLLVCGEVIPLVQIKRYGEDPVNFYSAEKAIDYMQVKGVTMSRYWSFFRRHYVDSVEGVKHFFKDKEFSGLSKLHYIYGCPIILCKYADRKDVAIILNPNLKQLGYQTQKDPYTLFQTIYMFLSGVLGTPEKEPLPISDEIKAANHGHDSPYSFKNVPGRKRSRNK